MDIHTAASIAQVKDTVDRISADHSKPLFQRASELGGLALALRSPLPSRTAAGQPTIGSLINIAMGAALGVGLAKGLSSGGFMGTTKTASEARTAFRLGFLKRAAEAGHLKTSAVFLPFAVSKLTGLSSIAQRAGENVGAVTGMADAPDDVDVDIVRAHVETELLRQELRRAKAMRQNQILKQILANRRA